ncbi:MAG: T9SS type A sorting domain-containing protein [Bacteroidia bacterium]
MKHIFLFLAVISMGLLASAQSLELTGASQIDTVYFNTNDGFKDAHGYIKNTSTSSITIDAVRVKNVLASGHESNFCWGIFCYDVTTDASQNPVTLGPGQVDSTYKVTLTHYGIPGTSEVTMVFKNQLNAGIRLPTPLSSWKIRLRLWKMTSQALATALPSLSSNPVSTTAQLRATVPAGATANLVLTDLNGRSLKSQQLGTSGMVELPVAGLASGIYMARLEVNGQALAAIKLVKE